MLQQKALLPFSCLLALAASLTLALPPGAPWTSYVSKPVYSRAIGPMSPAGMNTISVPYMPKSPFFPKFVDPKMMITKKTDMLSNLFGGLGPVAYNMADTKPYDASGSSLDNTDSASTLYSAKRDTLLAGKEKMIDNSGMYKRGMFGPFGPMGPVGPMGPMGPMMGPAGPKFGPFAPFSAADAMPDYTGKGSLSRRRRSIGASSPADDVDSILYKSAAENTAATKPDVSGAPKEYLPGMFGPGMYGPGMFGPLGPAVDPSMFTAKKSTFLDTLFKNIASSTPAPTEAPVPKSTIVPPSFWVPSSIIPGPTEYTSKVSDFLDKLFDSLNLNATATEADGSADGSADAKMDFVRSLKPDESTTDKSARSLDDPSSSIAAAKDAIVDTIMSELSDLKGDMMATLNDLIAYEKATAAATATAKKPFKPPFAGIWPPKPTVDPTLPYQQRMAVLSQVFDMLTDLQRNITVAANNAAAASPATPESTESPKIPSAAGASGASQFNATLLNAVLKKLSTVASPTSYPASDVKADPIITSRALSKGPTSFWVSYPENTAAKRQADDYSLSYFGDGNDNDNDDDRHDRKQYTRGVKMQMHQGYQSLPAGSVESVQAGGGSTPEHQGGGIRLLGPNAYGNLNKWADWMQYHMNEYQDQDYHRHHHNHH